MTDDRNNDNFDDNDKDNKNIDEDDCEGADTLPSAVPKLTR
jgi:hypothetical protein